MRKFIDIVDARLAEYQQVTPNSSASPAAPPPDRSLGGKIRLKWHKSKTSGWTTVWKAEWVSSQTKLKYAFACAESDTQKGWWAFTVNPISPPGGVSAKLVARDLDELAMMTAQSFFLMVEGLKPASIKLIIVNPAVKIVEKDATAKMHHEVIGLGYVADTRRGYVRKDTMKTYDA